MQCPTSNTSTPVVSLYLKKNLILNQIDRRDLDFLCFYLRFMLETVLIE